MAGGDGLNGSVRNGGAGGTPNAGPSGSQGAGADGGSSFGWFDESSAEQILDVAEFIEGAAGPGGAGSSAGAPGLQVATNV